MSTTAESVTLPEKYIKTPRGVVMNPEFVALWKPYLEEGMGYKHVAEVFGVGKSTVRNHYPGMGWPQDEGRKLGTFMKHHNEKMRKAERKNYVAKPHDPVHNPEAQMLSRRAAGRSTDVLV